MTGWAPSATREAIVLRARLYALVRRFFAERGVLEVETPVLSASGNTDPNIESFTTGFSGHRDAGGERRWLRTSPEYPMKRLLAAGVGSCYELGRVFRDGEFGRLHNPEFTMLEWYRVGWDQHQLMDECAELVREAMRLSGRRVGVRECSYRQLFQDHLGLDPFTAAESDLRAPLALYGIDAEGLHRDDWLDLLITHLIQPTLPEQRVLMVYDYPASQSALARIRPGPVPVAERFELFLGPVELANGYRELGDPVEQRERFARDLQRRRDRGATQPAIDAQLLDALPSMPDCAGVALGIDRLLLAMIGGERLDQVLAFPFDRA